MAGVQVPLGEGLPPGPPRSSTGKASACWGKISSFGRVKAARGHCPQPGPLSASAPLDKAPLNNAVAIAPSLGRSHNHNKRLPLSSSLALPAPTYTAYATLKAGGECHCRMSRDGSWGDAPKGRWGRVGEAHRRGRAG